MLALALLPAVDSAAGAVIAACLNDPGRSEPTLALAQRLWDEPDELLRCFDPAHALFRHGLLAQRTAELECRAPVPALVARELLFPTVRLTPDTSRYDIESRARQHGPAASAR